MVTIDEKFLPFIRTDRYGEGGWAPQHIVEKARLVVLAFTLLPCRFLCCLSLVASYYLIVRITSILPIPEIWRRRLIAFTGKLWSRFCLFALGFVSIKWIRVGTANSRGVKRRSVAVVSNHMGWADILIQMARYFPAFVARDGTQHLPMIGFVSQRMQCLYVDREKNNGSNNSNSSNGPAPLDGPPKTQTEAKAGTESMLAAAVGQQSVSEVPSAPVAGNGGVVGVGVSSAVKQRMLLTAQQPQLELRPMLLFPEGTTSNGHYLLPFKTGAFLAGVPVLPTIIHYSSSSSSSSKTTRAVALVIMTAAAVAAAAFALSKGASVTAAAAASVAAAAAVCVLSLGSLDGGGGVSPCWESIDAARHLLLMMTQPFHIVKCYELPLYVPNEAEKSDPKLYAANVRQYMLKHSADVAAAAAARAAARKRHSSSSSSSSSVFRLLPSDGLLSDKRRYQEWLRSRRKEVEAGRGITAEMFQQQQQQQQQRPKKQQ